MKPYKDDEYYPVRVMGLDIGWYDVFKYKIDGKYKHLIGVQFNKIIYSFRQCSPRYVHDITRDKDGDVCIVDQYGIYYKLRDVEFFVSDEHDDTMSYQQYSKFVSV